MIPDPVEIPSVLGFNSISFDPVYKQQNTPGGMGAIQTINRASPMWAAEYATPPLIGDKYNAAIAWLDGLEGALNPFLGYDPRRVMPYAYRSLPITADPWTQTGASSPYVRNSNYANSTLGLLSVEPGSIFTRGDYISFFDGTAWWLYRVAEDLVAANNSPDVKVFPRPKTLAAGYPFAMRYRKACCAMKIIGGYTAPATVDTPTVIQFKAYQFIKRTV